MHLLDVEDENLSGGAASVLQLNFISFLAPSERAITLLELQTTVD